MDSTRSSLESNASVRPELPPRRGAVMGDAVTNEVPPSPPRHAARPSEDLKGTTTATRTGEGEKALDDVDHGVTGAWHSACFHVLP